MQEVTKDRNKYIGGSDIPILMGISHFKDRFTLLLEKAGLKEVEFKGNEYTEYGNILEPKIREYINITYKKNFIEGKHINNDIRVHTDGEDEDTILEIKTTSQIHEDINDYKVYLVQLLFYMQETKKENGILAVYERPDDFSEDFNNERLNVFNIKIEDYKELLEQINNSVVQFRIDLEKIKANPFITEEELLPIDLTELSNKILVIEKRLAEYKALEEEQKELKAQLKKAMEDKSIKKWETPNGIKITLVSDSEDKVVRKFNEKLFKENNMDLWDEYSEEVIQKGKSGYVKITMPKEVNNE